ncbi:MAG: MarR family transcriptional regulator [Candidatus Kapabacteria bacterium]|nr:MarR family transcriptional regulator [Candidatus Kapabacteria bacterium]
MKIEEEIKTTKFRSKIHKASLNILFTANWLNNKFNDSLKKYGILQEQFNVLRILRGSHPKSLCVRDIASRMIHRNSNVPRIVNRLERKKLVTRSNSESDRRETMISLTKEGLELLSKIDEDESLKEENIISLTDTEADILNTILDNMRK